MRRNQTLKPRWFHILLALSDRDRHGSDIVREVLQQTNGGLRLWPAMLYTSLEQMASQGLIVELTDSRLRPAGASGKRRYFRITDTGRQMLAVEADRLAALARIARAKNVLTGGESP
jgi:DNA-binding PadR family transcriptional regulator